MRKFRENACGSFVENLTYCQWRHSLRIDVHDTRCVSKCPGGGGGGASCVCGGGGGCVCVCEEIECVCVCV